MFGASARRSGGTAKVRPSERIAVVRAVVSEFLKLIVGAAFLLVGLGLLVYEAIRPPIHSTHVLIFAGIAILGALIVTPNDVGPALSRFGVFVVKVVPVFRGSASAADPAHPDRPVVTDHDRGVG